MMDLINRIINFFHELIKNVQDFFSLNDYEIISVVTKQVYAKQARQNKAMEIIRTLELQGCKWVRHLRFCEGFECWKEAFRMRKQHDLPRDSARPQNIGIYTPFRSVKDLYERREQECYMMMEALSIYIRWKSLSDISTINTAIEISEHFFKDDYITNEFLMEMFRLNWNNSNPLNKNVHFLFKGILDLRGHRRASYFDCETASKEISMYMDYIEEKIWPHFKKLIKEEKNKREHDFEKYVDVAYYLLRFTQFFLEARPSSELADALLIKLVRLIREEKRRNVPTTLLHQAVNAVYLFGVKLLVQCGAEINTPDYRNNLPIYELNFVDEDLDDLTNVASFLIRNGSEVDAMNYEGGSVHAFLQKKKVIKNNLEKVSLKCLAARAISKYKIKVHQDECPKNLIPIIKIHGGCIV